MKQHTTSDIRVELLKGFDNRKSGVRSIPTLGYPVNGIVGIKDGETNFYYTHIPIHMLDKSVDIEKSTKGPAIEYRSELRPNIVFSIHGARKFDIIKSIFSEKELENLAVFISTMIGGV